MKDFKIEILKATHRIHWISLAKMCHADALKFQILIDCLKSDDLMLQQKSANILNHFFELFPNEQNAHLDLFVSLLSRDQVHSGLRRNTLRWLQSVDLSMLTDKALAIVIDHCFTFLGDRKEAIAVRAFSMTVLYHASILHPDLKNELKPMLQEHLEYGSPGEKSRARKILALISSR